MGNDWLRCAVMPLVPVMMYCQDTDLCLDRTSAFHIGCLSIYLRVNLTERMSTLLNCRHVVVDSYVICMQGQIFDEHDPAQAKE